MKPIELFDRRCRSPQGLVGSRLVAAAAIALAMLASWSPRESTAQAGRRVQSVIKTEGPAVREFRIWNISNKPFHYRLAKARGRRWTNELTLAPGEHATIREPRPGQKSELLGLERRIDDFIDISFPSFGGYVHEHLSALGFRGKAMPNWFHVIDASGFSELIPADRLSDAKARQEEMQEETPLTPREIESLKKVLRANWVLYDR